MNTLRQDSLAGIVVFLVALPLCLGIAQASGLPPFVGLLTGIIGGLVVTALSPSRFAVSGPAAGLVTIVVAAIESLGSFSLFLMALALAGVLQLLFGILRAGRFISLVPASVIKGMLAAIGILLIIQQIPVALGSAEETGLVDIVKGNATFSLSAIAVAAGGLLVLWLWGSPLIRRVKSLRWIPRAADRRPARLRDHPAADPFCARSSWPPYRVLPCRRSAASATCWASWSLPHGARGAIRRCGWWR